MYVAFCSRGKMQSRSLAEQVTWNHLMDRPHNLRLRHSLKNKLSRSWKATSSRSLISGLQTTLSRLAFWKRANWGVQHLEWPCAGWLAVQEQAKGDEGEGEAEPGAEAGGGAGAGWEEGGHPGAAAERHQERQGGQAAGPAGPQAHGQPPFHPQQTMCSWENVWAVIIMCSYCLTSVKFFLW